MEKLRYILCLIVTTMVCAVTAYCQPASRVAIYNAYVKGDIDEWKLVMERVEAENPTADNDVVELLNYYYGYIGYMISNKNNKEASSYIKKGEKLIDRLLENNPKSASANIYKGTFIAFKIALGKIKAVTLGPQSIKYINRAYEADSTNVQVIADRGNMLYYAPGMFGGSKKEAIRQYMKAINLLEVNNQTSYNWYYLHLLTVLAKHYEETGNNRKALATYEKILNVEPEFKWVKDELYPALLQKM